MKQLWAPWRIEYVLSEKPRGCIFCEYPQKNDDRQCLILYRGRLCYVIMNKYPYNPGHLMVVPFEHAEEFGPLGDEVLCEIMELTKRSMAAISRVMSPEGFNAGINIGKAAGAGIKEHIHMHIVPRWTGDNSFMAVLDEVHVIPEHLRAAYEKLYPVFNE